MESWLCLPCDFSELFQEMVSSFSLRFLFINTSLAVFEQFEVYTKFEKGYRVLAFLLLFPIFPVLNFSFNSTLTQ